MSSEFSCGRIKSWLCTAERTNVDRGEESVVGGDVIEVLREKKPLNHPPTVLARVKGGGMVIGADTACVEVDRLRPTLSSPSGIGSMREPDGERMNGPAIDLRR